MNIICLLSVRPCEDTYNFFKSIKVNTQYEVYIVIDDNNYNIPNYDGVVNVIKINNSECELSGFKSTVLWLDNKACSRDKALYYFTKESIDYNYIWFIEEDVFIPNIHTIENIDKKYESESKYDLLVSGHEVVTEKRTDWHWNHVDRQIKINPPYAWGMICAIRCSKAMLNCIKEYATVHKNLFLDEVLFNTLAIHNNLTILCIKELSSIHYRKDWKRSDIIDTNLYHPIKDIKTHISYRNSVDKALDENIDETIQPEVIILNTEDASKKSLEKNGASVEESNLDTDVNEVKIGISHVNENVDEITPTEDASQKSLEQTGASSDGSDRSTDVNEIEISIPPVNGERRRDSVAEVARLNSVSMSKEFENIDETTPTEVIELNPKGPSLKSFPGVYFGKFGFCILFHPK